MGRPSVIFDDQELLQAIQYLPSKYGCFKAFVQYQASVDGRYLTNLYDSYSKRN